MYGGSDNAIFGKLWISILINSYAVIFKGGYE